MLALLRTFSWQELRRHPWRNGAAVAAIMLGVALALAVQLINASALDEFASAVRTTGGQPDVVLRSAQGSFDERWFAEAARQPQVAWAAPVLDIAVWASAVAATGPAATSVPLRLVGADALALPALAPELLPRPVANAGRYALFAPATVFLNAPAIAALGLDAARLPALLDLREGTGPAHAVQVAGTVAASGAPLAVMDIGAAQDLFGRLGRLSRIDVRLAPGADGAAFAAALRAQPGWPREIDFDAPGAAVERMDNLSRAYRVNLTVLALVALFTGAFLVFSVLSLGVAKRAQQFALFAVLGLTPRERLRLVLAESLALGASGSLLGVALGTALAALALRLLGSDLGGGYFQGVAPRLHWSAGTAGLYAALGLAAALAGGWWPARRAARLPPAQTLKGLGATDAGSAAGTAHGAALGSALMATGALLALAPPIYGVPLGAYLSVGLLLVGGIAALPPLVALVYDRLAPHVAQRPLPLLAVERARRMRESAAVAVSGVVASLALAVALTVMVASFRDSVARWLDVVLPADLYVRDTAADGPGFAPAFVDALGRLPGVARTATLRVRALQLDPARPTVALVARALDDPARTLPLQGAPLPVPPGRIGIYVSEPMVSLYGARPGADWPEISKAFGPPAQAIQAGAAIFFVAGVWRDYARQFGAIAIDARDYQRLSGDARATDVALWIAPGADAARVQSTVRAAAAGAGLDGDALELTSSAAIRANSLRIFDRSFVITTWLQFVAMGIGLFGVAASFSAQVLARRKEFGLLAHLGLTRGQILAVVAGEGAAWTAIGALAGLGLGLAVSVVLVHVVNPQSFHWTMDLALPWPRLGALCVAVVAAGTATAWAAGRAAAGRDAVLAVKEDW
ncbi:ABC transporter permease [Ramlibacter sp. H39-3-26]|uniref:ABC transporter permease n=1 Tax=Curvibacter soli TaxID=3031331 RepID=UPI0023DBE223|nr:ABC transporter permease [Ramlibacter sp. H39-3-26]MDF1484438.1 ABC transporter permease [Ramlibacter sp. H39-3-26]